MCNISGYGVQIASGGVYSNTFLLLAVYYYSVEFKTLSLWKKIMFITVLLNSNFNPKAHAVGVERLFEITTEGLINALEVHF